MHWPLIDPFLMAKVKSGFWREFMKEPTVKALQCSHTDLQACADFAINKARMLPIMQNASRLLFS